jgi:aspartate kinase
MPRGVSGGPGAAVVDKFGGTSLGSAERLHSSLDVLLGEGTTRSRRRVVVVSAPAGVTDALVEVVDVGAGADLAAVKGHCLGLAEAALPAGRWRLEASREIQRAFASARRALGRGDRDVVLAAGERASLALVTAALCARGESARGVDATRVLKLDDQLEADLPATRRALDREVASGGWVVVPGFFAATPSGRLRILGRGASDLSATLLGAALEAELVRIWTDTAGVWSADPRVVRSALPIPRLTWAEAGRMAAAGAKVLHPDTVEPVRKRGIEIVVADPRSSQGPVTRIGGGPGLARGPGRALVHRVGAGGLEVTLIVHDGTPAWPAAAELVAAARTSGRVCPLSVEVGRGRVDFRLPGCDLEGLDVLHRALIARASGVEVRAAVGG